MITFRDMTFCNADCFNFECHRHSLTHAQDRLDKPELHYIPTAWSDFSADCKYYQPTEMQHGNEETQSKETH